MVGLRSLANCNPLALGAPGVVVVIARLSPALTLNEYQSALLPPRPSAPTPETYPVAAIGSCSNRLKSDVL